MVSAPSLQRTTVSSRSAPRVACASHNGADERAAADAPAVQGSLVPLSSRQLGERYRLIRELARGNMGSVWLAEHLGEPLQVAIKRLHGPCGGGGTLPSEDPALARARLLVEARVTSRLHNPHVVRVIEYGIDADEAYIVMELLSGESLAALLHRQGPLEPEAAATLLAQVGEGLEHVHGAAVVHRDLKPENIFIVDDGGSKIAKIVDFGVAKPVLPRGSTARRTGFDTLIVGTPQYMSPEQTRGCAELDHRADVWSFGVVAYECLLGFPPFSGKNLVDLMLAICSGPLPRPSAHGRVPAGFDSWFRTACAREPDQRFASAREAAEALRASCATPLAACPGLFASALRRWFTGASRPARPGLGERP
jgi:serine/threonine protein kinase